MHDLLEIMRREAAIVAAGSRSTLILVVNSYNPNKYRVKGTLQPYGVQSGWMKIGSIGGGNGFGAYFGPSIGDQMAVDFLNGDPNAPIATWHISSNSEQPPVVQSGEFVVQAAFGQKITMTKDGNLLIQTNGSATVKATGALAIQGSPVNIN